MLRKSSTITVFTGVILALLTGGALFAQAPGVQWRRTDWFPTHPVTGPQTQDQSGEDWWYDHKNSYSGSHALQGYITAGFSSFVNWAPNDVSLGGCVDAPLNGPDCSELETQGNVTGGIKSTLALIDPAGTTRFWFKAYNLGFFYRVIQTSDGGYLATGTTTSTVDFLGKPIYYNPGQAAGSDRFTPGQGCPLIDGGGKSHVTLVKTDASGNVQWQYLYGLQSYRDFFGNPDPDEAFEATGLGEDLLETSNGHFIVVGSLSDPHYSYSCNGSKGLSRAFLIEVDATGSWVSGRYLGSTTELTDATAISQYSNQGKDHFLVSGTEFFTGAAPNGYTGCKLFQKVVLQQLDGTKDHAQEWRATDFDIASPASETASQRTDDVQVSTSGQILLPIIEHCTGCLYAGFNSGQAKVFRLNKDGQTLATSDLGTVTAFDLKLRIVPTANDGFAAVSSKQVTPPPALQPTQPGCYNTKYWNTDAYVGQFNSGGVLEWATTFDSNNVQTLLPPGDVKKQECLYSISQGQDGGFVVSGNHSSNFDDDYLAKLDPAPPHPGPDLSISDTPFDAGLEPNPDPGPMWISDDIWVRNQDDQGIVHQNPQYKATGFNYVYVRVTNRGDAAASGVLKVYWAKASTGLSWPMQWFQNFQNGLLFGDQIPVTVPINLAAHTSTVVPLPWHVPNPQDFGTGADRGHFCLLARVETAASAPFGMTSPEGADVYQNTRNNNNIAWKNVSILDGPMKQGFVLLRNVSPRKAVIRLGFDVSQAYKTSLATFLDYGTIDVSLGRDLFERWTSGGRLGRGVEVLEKRRLIRLVVPNAWIGGIKLAPGEMKSISAALNLTHPPPAATEFHLEILQYSSVLGHESLVGGQRFTLPAEGAAPGPDLSLSLSDGGSPIGPGNTLHYKLSYANGGSIGATGVVLKETVPASTTFSAGASTAGWVCSPDNKASSICNLAVGTVAAQSGARTATFAVNVDNPLASGVTRITNTATLSDDGTHGTDPAPGNNTASATTAINPGLHLNPPTGLKTMSFAPPNLEWRLVWINNQNGSPIHVQITDPIPAGTTYVAGSLLCSPQGASTTTACSFDAANLRIFWEGGIAADSGAATEAAAANEIVITFRAAVDPAAFRVENQAHALTDTNGDGDFSDEDPSTAGSASNTAVWNRAVAEIPTASAAGLAILFCLLATAGWLALRGRRPFPSPCSPLEAKNDYAHSDQCDSQPLPQAGAFAQKEGGEDGDEHEA